MKDIVLQLRSNGCAMIPSGGGKEGKAPQVKWVKYQKELPSKAQIGKWLVRWTSLWGMVTGKISDLVVVDTDDAETRAKMEATGLKPHVTTPRGGAHFYFKHPGHYIKTIAGLLPKIDIRGDGGFVNVVGKNPKTGGEYTIEIMPTPESIYPWDRMPKQILDAMNGSKPASDKSMPETQGTPIAEGVRNSTLTSFAGSMRHRGMTVNEIESALMTVNRERCQPPLNDDEVQKIARSVARYDPGDNSHLTDTGNAEFMAKLHGDHLRYDHKRKRWLYWGKHHWEPDKDGYVARLAIEAAKRRYIQAANIEDSKIREVTARWAINSESRMRVDACLSLASKIEPFADSGDNWDTDIMLLGCENGVIDLRTGELRDGKPEDRITMSTGVDFIPGAKCPRWEQFLIEILEDNEELIDWLWRVLGYSITGEMTEQIFMVGYGEGSNGRSKFFGAISDTIGDYAHYTSFATFSMPESSNTNDIAALENKRFVTSFETNRGKRLNVERIKTISGGDKITARYLYREFETYQPHMKLWMFVNHLPDVDDETIATWRRVRLIPFNRTFIKDDVDKYLGNKLKAEAQGILAWLVRGCLEWQNRGLRPVPECIRRATGEYRVETDPVLSFLQEYCVKGEGKEVRADSLYAAYKAKADGRLLTQTAFGRRMSSCFKKHRDSRGRYIYEDISLIDAGVRVWLDMTEEGEE